MNEVIFSMDQSSNWILNLPGPPWAIARVPRRLPRRSWSFPWPTRSHVDPPGASSSRWHPPGEAGGAVESRWLFGSERPIEAMIYTVHICIYIYICIICIYIYI